MLNSESQVKVADWYRRFSISDYVTLLHLPFSGIVLSFAVIGAVTAPTFFFYRFALSLTAVFFALQGAHYLDETKGRHWKTTIPSRTLYMLAFLFLSIACCIGVYLSITVSFVLALFLIPMVFFSFAYNLELWGEKFHNSFWFGVSWGSLVFLGSYFLQSLQITLFSVLMSVAIGVQSSSILVLYESTKVENTSALAWNVLRAIVVIWILLAFALSAMRFL